MAATFFFILHTKIGLRDSLMRCSVLAEIVDIRTALLLIRLYSDSDTSVEITLCTFRDQDYVTLQRTSSARIVDFYMRYKT